MNKTGHNPKYSGLGPPRTFDLVRLTDVTGVSGTGIVAEGCVFADGTTVIRWCAAYRSTAVYQSAREVLAIHGHNGGTEMRYHHRSGVSGLPCSNCAHAWGDHELDGANICSAGGCTCCLLENPSFEPVGQKEQASTFFLNEASELPRITKYQLKKQNKMLLDAAKVGKKYCRICTSGSLPWEFAQNGSDFCRWHQ